ncbi:MAG: monovalent cation/H+ antiporter subunit A [Pseudomonadota bacterium]
MDLALIVLVPFMGALLPPLFIRRGRDAAALSAGAVTLASLVLLLSKAPQVFGGEILHARFAWAPMAGLDANFFLDGLGFLFATLILAMGLLIIAFARYYLAKNDPMGRFFSYLLLFQGAMLGIVLSDNILLLAVFWELTSLSSFLLIGYWRHSTEARQGARMALAVTGGGGLALLAGLLLLAQAAGSYDLSEILTRGDVIQASPLYPAILALVAVGCFAKSAQFPLHFWLPHAMAAPTPVSAYLHSATMVKAGVFLLARLWPALAGTELWFYLIATTGLVTMVVAAAAALFKRDLKAILAYSTVSHLGLMVMLLGFGTPMAALVAVFHIINHATFKAALFMTAGIVDHEVGTRDIDRLGGLAKLMPVTATLAAVTALSMAGAPLLNGFLSKEMMLQEAFHTPWAGQAWVVPALATLGALLSAAYSLRYLLGVFHGPRRETYPQTPHEAGPGLWGPPAVLAVLVVLIGLFPAAVAGAVVKLASGAVIGGEPPYHHLAIWHGFTPALAMSAIALAGGALLYWRHAAAARAWQAIPTPEAKPLFDAAIAGLVGLSGRVTTALHTASLQRYLAALVATALTVGLAGFLSAEHQPGTRELLPLSAGPATGWLLLVTAALLVAALHRRRFLALIAMGIVGLIISIGFVYLSAPDLALTQISVEVVTIILLLLALNLLPKESPLESSTLRRTRDVALASLAGLGVGAAAWAVLRRPSESISDWHLENAYSGGGGTNVVNVILVDFRGFDTFGEIIVLCIAALGIFALLETRPGAWTRRLGQWRADPIRSGELHPMMLVVATRVMLPLALMVAAYVFLRGHNQPGGGFIAGLVVSIAFLMQYMASGFAWAQQRARLDHHGLIGWGVLTAGFTGLGALLFGKPFLTSAFDYFHLPCIGEFELATAMLFDVGVLLTVVGAVMLALAELARVLDKADPTPLSDEPMDRYTARPRRRRTP